MEPTYDFIYGSTAQPESSKQSAREPLRQSQLLRTTDATSTEALQERIQSLEYETSQLKKEHEIVNLQLKRDLEDARNKADAESRRAQTASDKEKAASERFEVLLRESREERQRAQNERTELERKLRTTAGQRDALQEQLEEVQEAVGNVERELTRKVNDLTQRNEGLQKMYVQVREEYEDKEQALVRSQQRILAQENRVAELEDEVMQLRSASEDASLVASFKKDVERQAEHIRKLEADLNAQGAELGDLRQFHAKYANVDAELHTLQERVQSFEQQQAEAAQMREKLEALQNERQAWIDFLASQQSENVEVRLESPEDVVRALVRERALKTTLEQQISDLQSELLAKETDAQKLREEHVALQAELKQLQGSATGGLPSAGMIDNRVKMRLERAKDLAVREAEFFRSQLKNFEAAGETDDEGNPSERYSQEVRQRIRGLENLLEQHKKEVESLHKQLTETEKQLHTLQRQNSPSRVTGIKRPLDEGTDDQVGQLLRKNRRLQNDVSKLSTRNTVLESELKDKTAALKALKQKTRTRVLELRDNPTAQAEKIKQRTLAALKSENEALRAQLEGRLPTTTAGLANDMPGDGDAAAAAQLLVPRGSLEALELALEEKSATIASREKSLQRLRHVFGAKGLEFREAVYSLLGWKLDFLPSGRVKASSMYYPGTEAAAARTTAAADQGNDGEKDAAEEEEHYIIFDGENGTMKMSGGPQSEFAKEIRGLVDFWVDARGSIPGLMAAMTLEFCEKYKSGPAAGGDEAMS